MNENDSTILLVEDNPDDEALCMRALRKNNFMNQIDVVRDGKQAVDYIFGQGEFQANNKIHLLRLILLDLKIPKIQGLDVLRAIRGNPETSRIPVVILSTSRERQDICDAYSFGANSYVCKSVNFNEFHEAVKLMGDFWLNINETIPDDCD